MLQSAAIGLTQNGSSKQESGVDELESLCLIISWPRRTLGFKLA
jgi:hypothetical protein